MTPQEIFNKVWDHLNKQGRQAVGKFGCGCHYRAPDGAACAVGCLVDDETAKRWDDMTDDNTIRGVASRDQDTPDFVLDNLTLLQDLQIAHDHAGGATDWLTEWRDRMARIADRHSLTIPEIPQ